MTAEDFVLSPCFIKTVELKVEAKKLDEQKSKEKVIANIPPVQNNKNQKVKSSR